MRLRWVVLGVVVVSIAALLWVVRQPANGKVLSGLSERSREFLKNHTDRTDTKLLGDRISAVENDSMSVSEQGTTPCFTVQVLYRHEHLKVGSEQNECLVRVNLLEPVRTNLIVSEQDAENLWEHGGVVLRLGDSQKYREVKVDTGKWDDAVTFVGPETVDGFYYSQGRVIVISLSLTGDEDELVALVEELSRLVELSGEG